MKKVLLFAWLFLCLYPFAACGNAAPPTIALPPTPQPTPTLQPIDGYLSVEADNVAWVKLVISDAGSVSGQWVANNLSSAGKSQQVVFPLSGTFAKSGAISLTLQGPLGVSINTTGTLKGNVLALDMEQGGATKHKVLNGTSTDQYQTALAAFQKKYPA